MIQDIAPWKLDNAFSDAVPSSVDLVLDINRDGLLCSTASSLSLPSVREWHELFPLSLATLIYAFRLFKEDPTKDGDCTTASCGAAFSNRCPPVRRNPLLSRGSPLERRRHDARRHAQDNAVRTARSRRTASLCRRHGPASFPLVCVSPLLWTVRLRLAPFAKGTSSCLHRLQ